MKTPKFLKQNGTIGICAPSFGCNIYPYSEKYDKSKEYFLRSGYNIIETKSVKSYYKVASAKKEVRAKEFLDLWFDEKVDFIFSSGGGEMMMEILEYIDFDLIKKSDNIKYFMGYSDNTNLTFLLTTLSDVKTIYGQCFPEFSMSKLDESLIDALDIINGKKNVLYSYPFYEDKNNISNDIFSGYNLKNPNIWKSLNYNNKNIKGRIIGGCLDILVMLCGTKYDKVKEFIDKYKEDGLIWYLESCDLNLVEQKRAFWQLKNAGWFCNAKCILVGRPLINEEMFDLTYLDVLNELGDMPIIYDIDIGHIAPTFTIINGAMVDVKMENGKGYIKYLKEE